MKKLRVLALVHESLVPPEDVEGLTKKEYLHADWKSEYDVTVTLREMGHEVRPLGLLTDLTPLREAIVDWKPDITFVLLEEFHGLVTYDHAVASYLELMRQDYTGCNARGLLLSRDKGLAKSILSFHRIPSPTFTIVPRGKRIRRTRRLSFPLFVKSASEDASVGISQSSIVHDDESLAERVEYIHDKVETDAMVEQFIEGRELYVGVIGNERVQTLPIWEMTFRNVPEGVPRIATSKIKWDPEHQKELGVTTHAAINLPPGAEAKIHRICKRVYRALHMSGFARMDLRLAEGGSVFVLEANANPNLAYGEDFAESAEAAGIDYEALLQRILNLGLRYKAPWKLHR